MKKSIKAFALSLMTLCVSLSALAQVTTSTIAGRVGDKEGAVAGAPVVAVYTPTGATYYSISDADGQYRINGVTAGGPYTVKVEMLGYSTVSITNVYAPLAETILIDAMLQEESISLEGVTITADSSESGMNIRRSGAGTSISQKTMETVPSVGRSMNEIMSLTPQAAVGNNGIAIGGGNYRGSTVTVDGAAFNNAFGIGGNLPAGGSPISLDAIEQMSINITPFDVRQSGFQGGAINAVTKSGSNQFHASAYDYHSSNTLRGAKVAGKEVSNTKSLNNTVGVTVGGPIIKNKLFFFVNAEYTFDEIPGSSRVARNSETDEWGASTMYNRPTVAQMDNMKSFLAEKFGYNPGQYQGYSLKTPDYKVLARIDWNINDNNKFNVRFSHTHTYGSNSPSSSMSPVGGTNTTFTAHDGNKYTFNRYDVGRQSNYAMFYEAARYFQEQNFTSVSAELNSRVLDGKGNNMFRATWSHQNEPRSYVGSSFPTVDILEPYTDANGKKQYGMFTTIGIDPFTYGNLREVQTITATDEFTYTAGKNNFIFGAQYEWNRTKNGYMQGGAGWFIYDSWDSFVADVTDKSSEPVMFMITHANLDDPSKQTFPTFDYAQASLYAQDEISFSDYFKLTAGIRFELPMITMPVDNYNKDFAKVAAANPTSSFAGLSTDDVPALRLNVSPRIGFNWDILKNRKLVLRGGTGLYTGRIPNVWLVSAIGNSNVVQYQYIANNKTGNPVIHFSSDRNEIINSVYQGTFTKQDLAAPTGSTFIDKNLKLPTSWKSSLAVDFELPGGVKASVEGIYSRNYNEVYGSMLGYQNNGTITLDGEPTARNLYKAEGITNKDGGKMNGYHLQNIAGVHGSYYSVTAQLRKSFAFGLDLMAAYTNSGAQSLSDGYGDQLSEFANTYNVNDCNSPELGYSSYVTPNRVIASVGYTINEGSRTATKLGLFYEGLNLGYVSSITYSRVSYLMNNVSGVNAAQLIYIPTDKDLQSMKFTSEENKAAFVSFIESDKYLSKHRGEYSKRNCAAAPWHNTINLKVAQDIFFNIADQKHTLEIALDVKNVGNLLNNNWGVYKQISSCTVLNYKDHVYTFTQPVWNNYNSLASTWQMLLSAKYYF